MSTALLVLLACVDPEKVPDAASDETGRPEDTAPAVGDSGDSADSAPPLDTAPVDSATDTAVPPDPTPVWDCSTPLDICASGSCAVTADASIVRIGGTARFNGDPLSGEVRLREETLDRVVDVDLVDGTWEAHVSKGDYAISWDAPGATWVGDTEVRAHTDTTVALSDERIPVTGTALWLGQPIQEYGDFDLTYEVTFAGVTSSWDGRVLADGTWEAWVPAGHYDVRLRVFAHGLSAPGGAVSVASVDITEPTTLALDSVAARLATDVTFATASEALEAGTIGLWSDDSDWDETSPGGQAQVDAPVGTYELRATYGDTGIGSTYGSLLLDPAYVHAADATLSYAVDLYDVGGLLSVTGLDLSDTTILRDCPVLYARDMATGLVSLAACPGSPTWHMALPAGTFDFYLLADGAPGTLPLADDVTIAGDTTLDLVTELVPIPGTVRYDGGEPPWSGDGSGRFWTLTFTEVDRGYTYDFTFDGGDPWEAELPPGTYAVTYTNEGPAFGTWADAIPVADTFVVADGATLDVDVGLVDVGVTATIEGGVPTHSTVMLGAQEAWLDDAGTTTLRVPPGTYALSLLPDDDVELDAYWATLHPCVAVTTRRLY